MSNARSFSEQETTVICENIFFLEHAGELRVVPLIGENMIALTQLLSKANNASRGSQTGANHYTSNVVL
jgi:hypothetical protein